MNVRTVLACAVSAVLGAGMVAAVTSAGDSSPSHYTVEAADTWQSIALAHGVSADVLQLANNLAASTSNSSHPRTGWVIHIPEAPAPTTTAPTTVAPSTTSTTPPTTVPAPSSTAAPSTSSAPATTTTTVAPSSTTTQPPSTTSSTSSSTSTTLSPTTTTQPPGVAFSEDFSDPQAFYSRFDHQYEGDGAGSEIKQWNGDHDMSCGDPNATHRTITVTDTNRDAAFYPCAPGGDPAKAHVMTAVNTTGYVIAWFSPKPTFANVKRVCWDQNIQDLGGGKWTQVLFITQAEAARVHGALGFTSPEFSDPNGTGTDSGPASHGVKLVGGGMTAWSSLGEWNEFTQGTVQRPFGGNVGQTTDKAPRYQQCVTDNGNGTLTAVRTGPSGTQTSTVQGDIPNEPIRVVFEDDNYDPPKRDGYSPNNLTWHWDNIQITTG